MNRLQLIQKRHSLLEEQEYMLIGTDEFNEIQSQINDINEYLGER